ncbi:hypothetical protein LTS18_002915 [Coniosporium uncinatum]|uniref:Uncharacterized protein n=1 Tax=Coniosporium uncinatum TaxID=93489 RepID=A0ACC3DU84_9PEZI|nr:hypothetical protein LTS18_002915 [Coniosporium uncinatum]
MLENRQLVAPPLVAPPAAFTPTPTSTAKILTFITPSPQAAPVPITSQSQVVTSYVAQATICPSSPLAFVSGTYTSLATPYYRNVSTSTDLCQTIYSTTETTVCATVLTGIASKVTVTSCSQNITFSREYGYVLETPPPNATFANVSSSATDPLSAMITPTPTIRSLTTYYYAPWQSLTAAGVAPLDVDKKICSSFDNGTILCNVEYQEWDIELVTMNRTTTTHIDFITQIPGPAQLIIETVHMDIVETLTTVSLVTNMVLGYQVESTTLSMGPRPSRTTTTEPETTVTYSVLRNTNIVPGMFRYGLYLPVRAAVWLTPLQW